MQVAERCLGALIIVYVWIFACVKTPHRCWCDRNARQQDHGWATFGSTPSSQVWRDVAASVLRLRNIERRQFEIASLFRVQYLIGKCEIVILRV